MEAHGTETPLKVCPHCSVASRTDSDTCPSCGRPYARGRPTLRWSWWLAIPIVAAAFAIGYFGISQLVGDDDAEGITIEQAEGVPEDVTRSELADELDGETPVLDEPSPGGKGASCSYYAITDETDSVWEFCFENDTLTGSRLVPFARGPVDKAP